MSKVRIYTTPTCPFCARAKKYLMEKGVGFEEVNVAVDREGLKALREKSKQIGVPVLEIDGKIIIGFNKEKVDIALSDLLSE